MKGIVVTIEIGVGQGKELLQRIIQYIYIYIYNIYIYIYILTEIEAQATIDLDKGLEPVQIGIKIRCYFCERLP